MVFTAEPFTVTHSSDSSDHSQVQEWRRKFCHLSLLFLPQPHPQSYMEQCQNLSSGSGIKRKKNQKAGTQCSCLQSPRWWTPPSYAPSLTRQVPISLIFSAGRIPEEDAQHCWVRGSAQSLPIMNERRADSPGNWMPSVLDILPGRLLLSRRHDNSKVHSEVNVLVCC